MMKRGKVHCVIRIKAAHPACKHNHRMRIFQFCKMFLCPRIKWSGHIVFVMSVCLSVVCLSVVNFNIRYNFWTARDRDFIYGMHTPLMTPFQMIPRSMTLTLKLKIPFWTLLPPGHTVVFHKHTLIFHYKTSNPSQSHNIRQAYP